MAAPVSIGQIAAETERKRRKRKRKPVRESDVVDHLWEQAKAVAEGRGEGIPYRPEIRRAIKTQARLAQQERRQAREERRRQDLENRARYKLGRELAAEQQRAYTEQRGPASILHTPEYQAWQARHHDPGSWGGALLDAVQMFAKTGELLVDFGTGIPTFVRDPNVLNLGIIGVSVIPGVGKVFRVLKGAGHGLAVAEQGVKVSRIRPPSVRTLRHGEEPGQVVHWAGSSSRTGAAVERIYDWAHYGIFKESAKKKAIKIEKRAETRRQRAIAARVQPILVQGRKLAPDEQATLMFYQENSPLEDVIAYHRGQADYWRENADMLNTGEGAEQQIATSLEYAAANDAIAKLAEDARKYLDSSPVPSSPLGSMLSKAREETTVLSNQEIMDRALRDESFDPSSVLGRDWERMADSPSSGWHVAVDGNGKIVGGMVTHETANTIIVDGIESSSNNAGLRLFADVINEAAGKGKGLSYSTYSRLAKVMERQFDIPVTGGEYKLTPDKVRDVRDSLTPGVRLRPDAPEELVRTWGMIERARINREDLLRQILPPQAMDEMVARVHGPARVAKGARFYPESEAARDIKALRRAQIKDERRLLKEARAESRAARRAGLAAGGRAERAGARWERLANTTPEAVRENIRVNRTALAGMDKRDRVARQIEHRLTQVTRKKTQLEDALTDPKGRTAGEIARRIDAVNEEARKLKLLKNQADRLRREGAENAADQALWANLAEQANTILAGRMTGQEIMALAAEGTRKTMLDRAVQVLLKAEDEVRAIATKADEAVADIEGKAGRIVGFEDVQLGRARVPHKFGAPGIDTRRLGTRMVRAPQQFFRSRKGVIRMDPKDPMLRQWTASLKEKGMIRTDVTNLVAEDLAMANKLQTAKHYRDILLHFSHDSPDGMLHPRPILVDLDHPAVSNEVRRLFDLMEHGNLTKKELRSISDETMHTLQDTIFGLGDRDEIVSLGREAAGHDPNVRWLEEDDVDRIITNVTQQDFLGAEASGLEKAAVGALEFLNDVQRFGVLYSNPFGYGVTNLLGNAFFVAAQQGVLAPINIERAFSLGKYMASIEEPELLAMLDSLAGAGNIISTFTARGLEARGAVKAGLDAYVRQIHNVVDLIPRRMALIHELRKEGVRGNKAVADMLRRIAKNDPEAWDTMARAVQRSNDALGDFELTNNFQKKILARLFFVMPWVKAASRYTYRFPLEHPVQAAGLGVAGYYFNENHPEGPYWLEGSIMLPEWFPYVGGQLVNPGAVMPFKTPIDFARAIGSVFYAPADAPSLFGQLNPFIQTTVEAVTGRDEFGRELEGTIAERFGRQALESVRGYRLAQEFMQSPEEMKAGVYPDTMQSLITRGIVGAAAPRPFNEDEAKAMERRIKGTEFSGLREDVQWAKDHPNQISPGLVTFAVKYRQTAEMIDSGLQALAADQGTTVSKLSQQQRTAVELNVLMRVRPELFQESGRDSWRQGFRQVFRYGLSKDIENYIGALHGLLEYEDMLGMRITRIIDNSQQALKDRQKATALAG